MLVYLDLVILINALVDFFILLCTDRLAGYSSRAGRCAAAAFFGAIYAGACFLPGLFFLGNLLWRIVCLCLIAVIAFGLEKSALERGAVFVLLSMSMGGLALAIGKSGILSIVLCGIITMLLGRSINGFSKKNGGMIPVELAWKGNNAKVLALYDTGNILSDPVSGERVLVADSELGKELVGLSDEEIKNPIETVAAGKIPGLRLVPYRSVGQPGGMMVAMRFHHVRIGDSYQDPLIAFAPNALASGKQYRMLVGGAV